MNDVAKEQYDCSWVYACTFMHAGDVENLMKKVARRYATAVAADALKRATQQAVIEYDVMGYAYISEQSILSTPINLEL